MLTYINQQIKRWGKAAEEKLLPLRNPAFDE